MNLVFSWFLKPYYFNDSSLFKLFVSFGFGLTIFLFLVIFKPFHIGISNNATSLAFNFGLITMCVLLFNYFILPIVFKSFFNPQLWTIGKEFIFGATTMLFISICNWLFFSYIIHPSPFSLYQLGGFLSNVVSVGFFPVLIFIFINEKLARNKRLVTIAKIRKQAALNTKKKEVVKNKDIYKIYADNKKDYLEVGVSNIVYISAQGNYVSFYTFKENETVLKESLIRTSLTRVKDEFINCKNIVHCHKSYLINTNFMDDLKGNARGYFLQSSVVEFEIPISRSFPIAELENIIK